MLRRRPEALLLVAGLVFLAGTGLHADRLTDRSRDVSVPAGTEETLTAELAPDDEQAMLPSGETLIGPREDTDAADYQDTRLAELRSAAQQHPAETRVAIVSLDDYVAPATAGEVIGDAEEFVRAVRWQLQEPGPENNAQMPRARGVVDGTVDADVWDAVVTLLQADAEQVMAEADDLESMAGDAEDPEFAETFMEDVEILRAAAETVGPEGCDCLYALELEAPLRALADLTREEAVTLIDVAPAGVGIDDVTFLALLPERAPAALDQP